MNRALVIQGGGFRTAFTAGVLDVLAEKGHDLFDGLVSVSGGAVAMSYFLAGQTGKCIEAIDILSRDPQFIRVARAISNAGYMDIDRLKIIAREVVPFEVHEAVRNSVNREVRIVATHRVTGKAVYIRPDAENWMDAVIASSTLPFITKGRHALNDEEYFDGGWSDPIPVIWAYEQGAREITVIRTSPSGMKLKQSWPDYLGSWFFRSNRALSDCFYRTHEFYNEAIEFISDPPADTYIQEIAPDESLQCGTYTYSPQAVESDYQKGRKVAHRVLG